MYGGMYVTLPNMSLTFNLLQSINYRLLLLDLYTGLSNGALYFLIQSLPFCAENVSMFSLRIAQIPELFY